MNLFYGICLILEKIIEEAALLDARGGPADQSYPLDDALPVRLSLDRTSTIAMNSATDIPSAGASLKIVFRDALFRPSSSREM